jgi:Sulfotransferase family
MNDDGEFLFVDALERLADSMDREANLSPTGRIAARNAVMASLALQISVGQNLERHPEIGAQPIPAPVFVVGLPGAGATLVRDLLAQHPDVHAPRLWELLTPAGPRGAESWEPAIRAARSFVDDLQPSSDGPGVSVFGATRPDECHRLVANTFQSMVFPLRYDVPSYVKWLARQDQVRAYRYHRLLLQSIRWRIPNGRLVLTCRFHIWALAALVRVYPEARLVCLHRSPAEVIPSLCQLCVAVRGAYSEAVDPLAVGAFWLHQGARALRGLDDVRRRLDHAHTVLDVRYRDLVRDPLGTVARICQFIGLPLTESAFERMSRYLAVKSLDDHAKAPTAGEFGLDAVRIDDRFAGYRRTYDL